MASRSRPRWLPWALVAAVVVVGAGVAVAATSGGGGDSGATSEPTVGVEPTGDAGASDVPLDEPSVDVEPTVDEICGPGFQGGWGARAPLTDARSLTPADWADVSDNYASLAGAVADVSEPAATAFRALSEAYGLFSGGPGALDAGGAQLAEILKTTRGVLEDEGSDGGCYAALISYLPDDLKAQYGL